jgi:hypothetical protein
LSLASGAFRKVVDNGQGAGGLPDEAGTSSLPAPPTNVRHQAHPIPTRPLAHGNFVDKDAD